MFISFLCLLECASRLRRTVEKVVEKQKEVDKESPKVESEKVTVVVEKQSEQINPVVVEPKENPQGACLTHETAKDDDSSVTDSTPESPRPELSAVDEEDSTSFKLLEKLKEVECFLEKARDQLNKSVISQNLIGESLKRCSLKEFVLKDVKTGAIVYDPNVLDSGRRLIEKIRMVEEHRDLKTKMNAIFDSTTLLSNIIDSCSEICDTVDD